jgi:integrase
MLGTGARLGEVAALTRPDVDLSAGTIRFIATKTGGQIRVLRVSPFVVDALRDHQKRQAEERLLMSDRWPTEHDALVFRSESGTPIDAANARRFVRSVAGAADIGHLTQRASTETPTS